MSNTKHAGYANYETWNVALYLNHDAVLYSVARDYVKQCRFFGLSADYNELVPMLDEETIDGVRFDNPKCNLEELNEVLEQLVDVE